MTPAVFCTGCGVGRGDWHRGRCLVEYGRWHASAWLAVLLLQWLSGPVVS